MRFNGFNVVKVSNTPGARHGSFYTIQTTKTMLERQKRLLATGNATQSHYWINSSGTEYKTLGLGGYILKKTMNNSWNSRKKLYKQHMLRWHHLDYWWTILAKNFDADSVEELRKFQVINEHKCTHKMNKQQIESWRHLSNLPELFLWKDLWLRQFLMLTKIAMKNTRKFVY